MQKNKLSECLADSGKNYILPFFWQHGEDDKTLLREIDAIHASGIRALCVESRTHEQFCEDAWWHTMDLILSACKERGMRVWLLDDKHFPSGYANGIISRKYPDHRMWSITERHMDVCGPQKDASVLFDRWKTAPEDILLGIFAYRRLPHSDILTGTPLDLTDCVSDGMVYFDVPDGCYRVFFLWKTQSGYDRNKLEYCDKLTAFGGNAFLEAVYEPHWEHYKDYFGNTFAGFFSDEPCFGNNNRTGFRAALGRKYSHFPYTEEVMEILTEKLGDGARGMLPALWFDTDDRTMQKIRLAYMDTVTALYRKNFSYKLGDWCRAHGVEYIGHIIEDDQQHTGTQDSAGHYFRALDGQDMAGIDVVLCQVVPGMTDYSNVCPCSYDIAESDFFHFMLPKLGSSHAHIQPLKKGRAMCEIYGAYGWAEGLKMMKWLTDFMLVRGINTFVPHAFTAKFPDPDCPPHFYAQGTNPQYVDFRLLMGYMNRVCNILNDGTQKVSAALLYHAEAAWAGGNVMRTDVPARYLTEHLLDYDVVPADAFNGAYVENRQLHIGNAVYPCLIVPASDYLPRKTLDALNRFADADLPVFVIDRLPSVAEENKAAVNSCKIMTVSLDALDGILRRRGFADVTLSEPVTETSPARFLRFCHTVHGKEDYYFITNENAHEHIVCEASFAPFDGGNYVRYDAMENKAVIKHSAYGRIPLSLAPYESVTLVFGADTAGLKREADDRLFTAYPLDLTWDILTATETEYPIFTPYRESSPLFNITGKDALPHFSGHIRYESSFRIGNPIGGMRVILDLGEVGESVRLIINNRTVGTKIAPPYRFDITDYVGDAVIPIAVEVTNHYGYQCRDGFSSYLLFEPSGLLGPVSVEIRADTEEA